MQTHHVDQHIVLRLHFRAEKEKMSEKTSEEEKQAEEEVDDSGFYAGETPLVFQSAAVKKR